MHVAVFGVRDEIGFSEFKALAFALAGFEEWCERGIDRVVRRLRPVACHGANTTGTPERYASPAVIGTSMTPS